MRAKMLQHAVGQGSLFSGELSAGKRPLRWVYDCGSNQQDALVRELGDITERGDIDLLYLSHLDSDHANGVDKLLGTIDAREVVLPYLDETILLATIARDAARGTLTGSFVELAADLAGWFGSRGVQTITMVNGREEDSAEGGDGPIAPEPAGREEDGDVKADWSRDPEPFSGLEAAQTSSNVQMQQVPPDAAMTVSTGHAVLNWTMIPYVHQPSTALLLAFDKALETEFGTPLDKASIIAGAKNSGERDQLRKCYDALWLDHNLVSMTLYCGPVSHSNARVFIGQPREPDCWWHEKGGWMLTGDAHLDRNSRRTQFLRYYQRFTPLVNVLMLPHHGSFHNHSDKILEAMPNLVVGYAAAGPNSYGHPSKSVRNAVRWRPGAHFHKVSEKRSSTLMMEVWM